MALNRLIAHVQYNDLFPDTKFGFRLDISMQEIMPQLNIMDLRSVCSPSVILGLNISKAFDGAGYAAIIANLNSIGLNDHSYN